MSGGKALLAFGQGALTEEVAGVLRKSGFQVSILPPRLTCPPKEKYDYLIQLATTPRTLTEGTHQLLEKAKEDQALFLLVSSIKASCQSPAVERTAACEALRFAEALTQENQRRGGRTTILRLPTLYGPGIPLNESGALGELLSEFIADQSTLSPGGPTLTVYGEGKDSHHYLYLTDAAEAIKGALTVERMGTTYQALPPAAATSAALADLLKELGGGRHEIRYHRGLVPIEEESNVEEKALPGFKPRVSLKEGIMRTLRSLSTEEAKAPSKRQKTCFRARLRLPRSRWPGRKGIIITALLFLLFSPFLYTCGRASLAAYELLQLRHQISTLDFQATQHSAIEARKHLAALGRFFDIASFSKRITPLHSLALVSQGGAEAVAAVEKIVAEGEMMTTAVENLFKSRRGEVTQAQTEEEFNRLVVTLKEAENHLLTSQLCLTQIGSPFNHWLAPLLDYLEEGTTALKLGSALASAAPDLLGYRGERNYLILFQNSAEARAGGGFLGSLAQLTLEGGRIKTLELFDSYQFDFAGGVPAPETTKHFLNMETLKLRESNYFASFPESAQAISQLFEAAQGTVIDGVAGINLLLAKELVALAGPLELTDSKRTVTAENLFAVTTEEVEKEFFPGSTKKKRFLQELGEALLNSLFGPKKESYDLLARIGWEGLKRHDLLLCFDEKDLTQTLIEVGFDGRIEETNGDFLMAIDSNYGSKANFWVTRSIDYRVFNSDRENGLEGKLTITWTHTGTESWPAGTYHNLFRLLVPRGSELKEAVLNGENYLPETMTAEEAGKTEFAAFLSIEPQTTVMLELKYRLPSFLNLETLDNYRLNVRKQPGTAGDAFTFTFEEPFGMQISGETLQREGNSFIFKGNLSYALVLNITIRKEN